MAIRYEWRGAFSNVELNALHVEGFGPAPDVDWRDRVGRQSLGWVVARDTASALVGFVNVLWDGGAHAFILDTVVATRARRKGIGSGLLAIAETEARRANCEWLHADYEEDLSGFYEMGCGFRPTSAGLLDLRKPPRERSIEDPAADSSTASNHMTFGDAD